MNLFLSRIPQVDGYSQAEAIAGLKFALLHIVAIVFPTQRTKSEIRSVIIILLETFDSLVFSKVIHTFSRKQTQVLKFN